MPRVIHQVSRSLSHFKYEGRWDCRQHINNATFIPTAENAESLESWTKNEGLLGRKKQAFLCGQQNGHPIAFKMVTCAVNCYIQWLSGLSCPYTNRTSITRQEWNAALRQKVSMSRQYNVARQKIKRYNAVIVTEKLKDPKYVAALERFFGVPGINQRKHQPWCQLESYYLNDKYPLELKPDTMKQLTVLNNFDINLYDEMIDCFNRISSNGEYNFPAWDTDRFARNESIQMNYTKWERMNIGSRTKPPPEWLEKMEKKHNITS